MIKFLPRKINMQDRRTPVMYDREIDELAQAILADYKPELLREPGKFSMEHFIENYLEAELQYYDIYSDDPDHPTLALTTFTDGNVNIFDRENKRVTPIYIPARTVIIDNEVMKDGQEGRALFSGSHEGGHLVIHWSVFVDEYGMPYESRDGTASVISCRRDNIESFGTGKKERSPADWREHQADYFAAAITMPNATFRPVVHRFLRENNIYTAHIVADGSSDLDILANDLMPEYISEVYGVSKRAALIKLRKSGFISSNIVRIGKR
jgi:Zn-dependent peptidase ImmA (M78 family)